jgi:hypothetical protein
MFVLRAIVPGTDQRVSRRDDIVSDRDDYDE